MIDPKAEAARRKAEELQKEKEAVIKEYEERMRKKEGWWKSLTGGGAATEKKKEEKREEEGADEREKDAKVCMDAFHLMRRCLVEDCPAQCATMTFSLLLSLILMYSANSSKQSMPRPLQVIPPLIAQSLGSTL